MSILPEAHLGFSPLLTAQLSHVHNARAYEGVENACSPPPSSGTGRLQEAWGNQMHANLMQRAARGARGVDNAQYLLSRSVAAVKRKPWRGLKILRTAMEPVLHT